MKNVLQTAVVSAVAAAFVASGAVAGTTFNGGRQQGPGSVQGRQAGPGGPGRPGGPGGGRMGPAGVPFEDLTEDQRQQIKAIMDEQRPAEGADGPADMKLRQSLETELLADAPNDQKIQELKGQIDAASAEQLARHISIQKRINQILTPEQRAKARERIEKRQENGPRGRRGGGRHHI
ncbi:MAG: Spy/CpxP family protein refolding chaperone [Vicinamibacterales bacterium]